MGADRVGGVEAGGTVKQQLWRCQTPLDGRPCGKVLGLIHDDGTLHLAAPEVAVYRSGVVWVKCPDCGGKRAWLAHGIRSRASA